MTMVGDSADPILASAAAFGAGSFDTGAALAAMVKGRERPCRSANGEYLERQGLAEYLRLGYVPFDLDTRTRNANSIYGAPDAVGPRRHQARVRDRRLRDRPARRAGSPRPRDLRQPSSPLGELAPSLRPRQRPDRAALRKRRLPVPLQRRRGAGFAEGNSSQYTWMVPQDPAGLIAAMGGPARPAARLDRFLRELNGGTGATHTDHAVLGDEPSLGAPWLYDWMRRPTDPGGGAPRRC